MRIDPRVEQRLATRRHSGVENGRDGDHGALPALLDAIPLPVIVADAGGRVLFANGRALTMLGYARSELLGRRFETLLPVVPPGDQTVARRKDGLDCPVTVSMGKARIGAGWSIVCLHDLADLRRELPAASPDSAVINGLRNALGILVSRIDLMLLEASDSPLPAKVRDDLAVLQRAAGRFTADLERVLP